MKIRVALLICLGIFLIGCSSSDSVNSANDPTAISQGQSLPISATVAIANETIELEVAKTPEQQAMGLMYRPNLEKNRGMLFTFDPPRNTRFWMKNVLISLDMIFLKNGEIIAIFPDVPPCQTTPCPTYGPNAEFDSVIELRGGRATELGIQVGDRVIVDFLNSP